MRAPRILGQGRSFYHCMSRVVDRRFVFEDEQKEFFRRTMRKLETFLGVRVVTYCLMSNHFQLNPTRRNPRMREMLLIGHSMGGMLGNIQIRTSGDAFFRMLFDRPIDEIAELNESQKATLSELLIFEANPDVSRAVFVASPHRGSKLARGAIGGLGGRLIKFPMELITAEPLPVMDSMTEIGREIVRNRPDSIGDLEPDSPGPKAVLAMPVRKGVANHSIIGRHKPNQPLLESTNTVVPYTSAHLKETVSETVVKATHTTITGNPEAVEELRRILYLHAGLPYRPVNS